MAAGLPRGRFFLGKRNFSVGMEDGVVPAFGENPMQGWGDVRGAGRFGVAPDPFDAIHDQTRPMEALVAIRRMLKTGGLFSMVDIAAGSRLTDNVDHPMGPFLYTVSLMHCMPVGLVNGGTGFGMMWGRQKAVAMLEAVGFEQVQVLEIPADPFNRHFFCRRPFDQ